MRKRTAAAVVALLVASWSGHALADEGEASRKSAEKGTSWYGWQTLMVDAVATTVMIGAVAGSPNGLEGAASLLLPTRLFDEPPKSTAAIDGSLALYTLGPAFVHAVHGRGVPAVLSPTIRAVAPTLGTIAGAVYGLAGAVIVSAVDDRRDSFGGSAGAVLAGGVASGYLLGFIAPMAIDAGLLAREPIEPDAKTPEEERREKQEDAAKVKWSPRAGWASYGPNGSGPNVGISGTF